MEHMKVKENNMETIWFAINIGDSVMLSDGYNLGLYSFRNREEEELKLNNVYGSGDIYRKIQYLGSYFWIEVGSYNLREDTEEYWPSTEVDRLIEIAKEKIAAKSA